MVKYPGRYGFISDDEPSAWLRSRSPREGLISEVPESERQQAAQLGIQHRSFRLSRSGCCLLEVTLVRQDGYPVFCIKFARNLDVIYSISISICAIAEQQRQLFRTFYSLQSVHLSYRSHIPFFQP